MGGHEDTLASLESHDGLLLEMVELEGILHRHARPQVFELRVRQYLAIERRGKRKDVGENKRLR